MESKFDYITLSIKSKVHSFEETFNMLCDTMLLGDLVDKMIPKGRLGYYDYRLEYEDIMLLFTTPERFSEQGICIKISSQGLDYFVKYLKSYGLTLNEWLGKFRALAFNDYITKPTRMDYALDDIVKEGSIPTITMTKVFRSAQNGEICKKARTVDILSGAEMSSRMRIKYCDGKPIKGRTLYIGVRQSGKLVRFYDKLAEQIQRKREVPSDVVSWTRCEVEFHEDSAIGVLNAFLDCDEAGFADYMCGLINNQCRFITRTNENISRCPVKRWWTEFLNGCTKCFRLPHKEPARSAYARAERGLTQYVRTIFTLYQEIGLEGLYRFFEGKVNELKDKGKIVYKPEIAENIREDIRDYEELNPFTIYAYNSDSDEKRLRDSMRQQHTDYINKFVRVRDGDFDYIHGTFMDGQEVFFDGL